MNPISYTVFYRGFYVGTNKIELSKLTALQFAEAATWLATEFFKLCVPTNVLDFTQCQLHHHPEHGGCKTYACHGGWACVIFDVQGDDAEVYFAAGAHAIAEHLGFPSYRELSEWAERYADVWGASNGHTMFFSCGYKAFGCTAETVSLQFVAEHYVRMAERALTIHKSGIHHPAFAKA